MAKEKKSVSPTRSPFRPQRRRLIPSRADVIEAIKCHTGKKVHAPLDTYLATPSACGAELRADACRLERAGHAPLPHLVGRVAGV